MRLLAHTIALTTVFAVLLATIPCFMSEVEASADDDGAAQGVDGDTDPCPTPEPCSDDCRCLCASGHGFVMEPAPSSHRPLRAAQTPRYQLVDAMQPGDYIDRIFRPPLSA